MLADRADEPAIHRSDRGNIAPCADTWKIVKRERYAAISRTDGQSQ
jgi:hypothetical protein